MSASEKLRALDGAMDPAPWHATASAGWCELMIREDEQRLFEALRNALPQIVAVVEKGARLRSFDFHATQHIVGLQHDGHDLRGIHVQDVEAIFAAQAEYDAAIAALDKALS